METPRLHFVLLFIHCRNGDLAGIKFAAMCFSFAPGEKNP